MKDSEHLNGHIQIAHRQGNKSLLSSWSVNVMFSYQLLIIQQFLCLMIMMYFASFVIMIMLKNYMNNNKFKNNNIVRYNTIFE